MAILWLDGLAEREVEIGEFGLKTAGLADLERFRRHGRLPYIVPKTIAVSRNEKASLDNRGLRDAYMALVSDGSGYCAVMARSSSPDEEPGKYTTIPVLYDPMDKEGSFSAYIEAHREVSMDGQLPVAMQKMVGVCDIERVRNEIWDYEDHQLIGVHNQSFLAASHSLLDDRMIQIAAVHGLPMLITENAQDPILIDINRGAEAIEMILYFDEHSYRTGSKSYRQERLACFSAEDKKIILLGMERIEYAQENGFPLKEHREWRGLPYTTLPGRVAHTPFCSHEQIRRVADVIKKLSELYDSSVEIEGTYPLDASTALSLNMNMASAKLPDMYLFQMRKVEKPPVSEIQLSTIDQDKLIAKSSACMGTGIARGHLVYYTWFKNSFSDEPDKNFLKQIDDIYGPKGYILLTGAGLPPEVELATPNRLARVTRTPETMLSHSIGLVRARIAKGAKDIYLALREEPDFMEKFRGRISEQKDDVLVFPSAVLESNGKEAQLYFEV